MCDIKKIQTNKKYEYLIGCLFRLFEQDMINIRTHWLIYEHTDLENPRMHFSFYPILYI